jgi:glyoxylase-like metal-dependent hydrolase (beta-lactamase superfamily II)/rhodanese-related sulfurtransferase
MSEESGRDYPEPDGEVESMSPADLKARLDAGEPVGLLDTRNRESIEEWMIEAPMRVEIPYMRFQAAAVTGDVADLVADTPVVDGEGPLVVVCAEGRASAYVADLLLKEGLEAVNLEGGMHGWARLYESSAVSESPLVVRYARPSSGCLAYLVVGDGEAAVVDPLRTFAGRYRGDAAGRGAQLRYALDTHVHADHVSGVPDLAATEVTGVLPALAVERDYEGPPVETLADGDALDVGGVRVEAVHAPGHTTGMTAYLVSAPDAGERVLLTGDGLFTERAPRPDLQEGDEAASEYARELHRTLTGRFARFDDDVLVAPGHHEPGDGRPDAARLGDLRRRLPAFSMDADAFIEDLLEDAGPRPANDERIIAINLGRADADDEEAFELELGPNNCAAGSRAGTGAGD